MHTYIIAEVGCNHNGDIEIAKEMTRQIAAAGCDAAKYQVFHASKLASRYAESAEYQKKNLNNDDSQLEMLESLELSKDDYRELKELCDELEIEFFATPFDSEAVEILEDLGVDRYKIGSGDVTDRLLLRKIALTGKPVILSTGMSTYQEIDEALDWLEEFGPRDISLLHCTSNYPTAYKDINMRTMDALAERYPSRSIGFSDHSIGCEIPVMAVARGAQIIEKHVTLDRTMGGPDHAASLELSDLPTLVRMVRNVEDAFGDSEKKVRDSEQEVRDIARKSIIAAHAMEAGHVLSAEDMTIKRPGTGIAPKRLPELIGKKLARDIDVDEIIKEDDLIS